MVGAHQPHFGAPGPVRLVEQARRIAGGRLVELELVPLPGVGEERRVAGDGQPVGGIGIGIDAQLRQAGAERGQRHPGTGIEDMEGARVLDIDLPARRGIVESPGAGLEGGDLAGMAGPGAGGGRRHQPGLAIERRRRRHGQRAAFDGRLHQRIERLDGLVMRDVLLGLARHDEGQREAGSVVHVKSPLAGESRAGHRGRG